MNGSSSKCGHVSRGDVRLFRFADDAVMAFEDSLDAKRVLGVLG